MSEIFPWILVIDLLKKIDAKEWDYSFSSQKWSSHCDEMSESGMFYRGVYLWLYMHLWVVPDLIALLPTSVKHCITRLICSRPGGQVQKKSSFRSENENLNRWLQGERLFTHGNWVSKNEGDRGNIEGASHQLVEKKSIFREERAKVMSGVLSADGKP